MELMQINKHGVTPEMLARGNEKEDTADVLKEWLENKNQDLREHNSPLINCRLWPDFTSTKLHPHIYIPLLLP
jgi:hypothetical protein